MDEKELQEIVEKHSSDFKIFIENESFLVDKIKMSQTDNPLTEPTTRGGVYFAEMKEWKIETTIFDTTISKHLSKAMLGPNKDFLDIILAASIENNQKLSLVTNLKNSMQNAEKIILYLTLKDASMELQ